jgi:pimeloyl-ACP methyl ester carboxylesterase
LDLPELRQLFAGFCIYHIDAPGQQEGAVKFDTSFHFPTIEQLSQQLSEVISHFKIRYFIGLGVGAGGTILLQYAVTNPSMVRALVLVGCPVQNVGLWRRPYWNTLTLTLQSFGVSNWVKNQFIDRWFSSKTKSSNAELIQIYKNELEKRQANNLVKFVQSYLHRPNLVPKLKQLTCKILAFCGKESTYIDELVELGSHQNINPSLVNTLAVCHCLCLLFSNMSLIVHIYFGSMVSLEVEDAAGLLTVERPDFITEPFKLFLMGLGYRFSSFDLLPPQIAQKINDDILDYQKKEAKNNATSSSTSQSESEKM